VTPGSARAAILIGAEELAELRGEEPAEMPPPVEVEAAVAQPAAVDAATDVPTPSVEAVGKVTADEPAATEEPATEAQAPVVEATPEAEVEAPAAVDAEAPVMEATSESETTPETEPLAPPKRGFTLFKQIGSATSLDADERSEAADEGSDAAVDSQKTFVAPKAGFHITEFSDAAAAATPLAPPDAGSASLPPPIARSAEPAPARSSNGNTKSWHIRNLRPGKKQRDEAAASEPAADDATDESDDVLDTGLAVSDSHFDTDPDVVESRRQINDRLRHRRCDEAASLLQRLATELGGKEGAELALDAGDRCRAAGKTNAALSCYLAASRADPVHETPLLRLADICLDDKDIDLAVSYLERVARLHRLRGDQKGALRVYRKIATVAPYRDDVMNLLMHVQATGRFEDE